MIEQAKFLALTAVDLAKEYALNATEDALYGVVRLAKSGIDVIDNYRWRDWT